MSNYYKSVYRVNKKGIRESKDRYVFINELIENFNYDKFNLFQRFSFSK